MYCRVPDPEIALTRKGHTQAAEAGRRIKAICDADGTPYRLFFYISPYKRSKQARVRDKRVQAGCGCARVLTSGCCFPLPADLWRRRARAWRPCSACRR